MDILALFCALDDFCLAFEPGWRHHLLAAKPAHRDRRARLSLSEVLTIIVAFHRSGSRTFKGFYTHHVQHHLRAEFPQLVSYNRFVELMPQALGPLCASLQTRKGTCQGIAFIDSTPLGVCHPKRAHAHKVFAGLAHWGKNSVGWFSGFKLPLVINDQGDLLAFHLTPATVDDRRPVPQLTKDLWGKVFGDRGYISQALFEQLFQEGLMLITRFKKTMKTKLLPVVDKLLLRKRALIETVNDQLKNISQIEHSRHRSVPNFLVNLVAGLIAYTYQEKRPSLNLRTPAPETLPALVL
jgi:Transposase DDE domain